MTRIDEVMAKLERDIEGIIEQRLDAFQLRMIECGVDPEIAADLVEDNQAFIANWRATTLVPALATLRQWLLAEAGH